MNLRPAARVLAELRRRHETVATAESLTGGMLGTLLTAVPGASASYVGGVISYATRLKQTLVGVDAKILATPGPVASATAAAMATGVADRCQADWGVATTGVAGPDPQDGHPVGDPGGRGRSGPRPAGDVPRSGHAGLGRATRRAGLSAVRSGAGSAAGYSLLMRSEPPVRPALLRELIGESLREERVAQGKTLREVSKAAQVSLGYLSEVERGQKEASSELLAAMCAALDLPLSVVLNLVSEKLAMVESAADGRVTTLPRVRALAQAAA